MRWTVLGSGAGKITAERSPASHLLETDRKMYLFDAGDGVTKKLYSIEKKPSSLEAVFISHLHPDHWGGFPLLIQTMHLEKRSSPLSVFIPEEGITTFKRMLEMGYLFKETLGFETRFFPILKNPLLSDEAITVSAYPTKHLKKYFPLGHLHPANLMESFCFRIEANGKTAVYSADLAAVEDITEAAGTGGELLIVEGMHTKREELGFFLKFHPFSHIVITHIPPNNKSWKEEDNIIISYDGFYIEI